LGEDVAVPAPEDHLRIVAQHAMKHGVRRPSWLCDIAAIASTDVRTFEWDRVPTSAHSRRWVSLALCAAHHLFSLPSLFATFPEWVRVNELEGAYVARSIAESWGRGRVHDFGPLWETGDSGRLQRLWARIPDPVTSLVHVEEILGPSRIHQASARRAQLLYFISKSLAVLSRSSPRRAIQHLPGAWIPPT
jgi:hypothetical protein